jgi:hypothetical protein
MVSSKIMWNSIISMPNAKFGGANIKNMYLKSPLNQYEYMKMPLQLIPDHIIEHYRLRKKAVDGYVYMEIRSYVQPPTRQHPCQQTPQTPSGTPLIL